MKQFKLLLLLVISLIWGCSSHRVLIKSAESEKLEVYVNGKLKGGLNENDSLWVKVSDPRVNPTKIEAVSSVFKGSALFGRV